jgi:hypothetical protein
LTEKVINQKLRIHRYLHLTYYPINELRL